MSAIHSAISAPLSKLALFVTGDIKGGTAAHAYRMDVIRTAIEQCFKGNYSPMREAITLATGKTKKARAYHAGFSMFNITADDAGMLSKVDYQGALNSHENKAARDAIADKTHHAAIAFEVSFSAVMAEKPVPKTAPVTVTKPDVTADTNSTLGTPAQHDAAVKIDDSISSVLSLISSGMLTDAQLSDIAEAIEARHKVAARIVADEKAAADKLASDAAAAKKAATKAAAKKAAANKVTAAAALASEVSTMQQDHATQAAASNAAAFA